MSTGLVWASAVCLLLSKQVEVLMLSNNFVASLKQADPCYRWLVASAHVLGWLAFIAWAVEGRMH